MMSAAFPAYESLLYTVFQKLRQASASEGSPTGLSIAFTSVNSGEGVSSIVNALLAGISRDPKSRALLIDSRHLLQMSVAASASHLLCSPLASSGPGDLYAFADPDQQNRASLTRNSWEGSWEYRRDVIAHLQGYFDYVLIDCPALREASDLLSLAPFVRGIILVVEAGRTRREQIQYAQKTIEFARGQLVGHVLNKRRYLLPAWLYKRL